MEKERLLDLLRKEGRIRPGSVCLCALSGGCDSVSLVRLLAAIKEEWKLTLYAVHINHGLRQEAEADEQFCIRLCHDLDIPLIVYRENIRTLAEKEGLSEEEAGRKRRYERFLETAGQFGADCILTGHHLDDQAETVLFHLFRGSGLKGLGGIRPEQALDQGIRLLRPLLSVPRRQLEAFLKEEKAGWREDASNQDTRYRRNYIRHELLPAIEEAFPGAAARIARTAGILQRSDDYLERETSRWLREKRLIKGPEIRLDALREVDPLLQQRLLRAFFLENGGVKDISTVHYEAAVSLLEKRSGAALSLPGDRILLREQEDLRIVSRDALKNAAAEETPIWSVRLFPYRKDLEIPDKTYTKWVDYAIMSDHVYLRRREDGDFFYLPGGGKKLLARYLVDNKIPAGKRNEIWVLADGPHVLWVVGYRLDAAAYIHENTRTVAEITVHIREESQ